jgi:hypothetical protein
MSSGSSALQQADEKKEPKVSLCKGVKVKREKTKGHYHNCSFGEQRKHFN